MGPNKTSVFSVHKEQIIYWKSHEYKIYVEDKKIFFWCKRIIDVVFSGIFILGVLSWMIPLLAICIKLDSPGPVFFFQRRVGKGGRSFLCYKFRSMFINPDAHRMAAVPNDRRITRFGKFLRLYNLDEFPQFFNVIRGEMSLIGPRPHMHADYLAFSNSVPGYDFRNLVRPGITGLAQVKGYSGPAETKESIFGRYQWDAFYVRNAGIVLDIRIFRKTLLMQLTGLADLFHTSRPGPRVRRA